MTKRLRRGAEAPLNLCFQRFFRSLLSRAERHPPPPGFSPGQPRLKPFLMEFDLAGPKPGAFTGLYGAPKGAPLQKRVEPDFFSCL